jgi:predicted MFS family arabinose efflux permease
MIGLSARIQRAAGIKKRRNANNWAHAANAQASAIVYQDCSKGCEGERVKDTGRLSAGSAVALVWLCSVAPLAAILIPLLLPVLEHDLHLGPRTVAMLASADLAGACITTVSAPLWLARTGSRAVAVAGLIVIVLANGAAAFAVAPLPLLLGRLVAGTGTGLVFSSAIPLVSRSARPARLVSALQVVQLLLAAGALAGAGWLLSFLGTGQVLLALVAVTLVSSPMALLLPAELAGSDHRLPTIADIRPGAAALVAILVYFASIAILTSYAGKLGVQHGLSIVFLSSVLAIGNLGSLPGSLIAMMANGRRSRSVLLLAGTLAQCLAVGTMIWVPGGLAFAAANFMVQLFITLIGPLQVAALVDQDKSGRAIEALAAMQSMGQAIGPLSVAFLITSTGVGGAYLAAMALAAVSAMLIVRPAFALPIHRNMFRS